MGKRSAPGIEQYLPSKARMPRPENTRWILYAIEKGIIKPIPATGTVLRSDGSLYKQYVNWCGYRYIKVYMHSTWFSFFVHKCIYLAVHGKIPRNKELDHDDRDLANNCITNIVPRTTLQNMRRRRLEGLIKMEAF